MSHPHHLNSPFLTPLQGSTFNGWGVTAFDSLDTVLLGRLDEEFERVLHLVKKAKLTGKTGEYASPFEIVIRYLGGLMSVYTLSKKLILLGKAHELAHVFSPTFNTSSRFPYYAVNPVS